MNNFQGLFNWVKKFSTKKSVKSIFIFLIILLIYALLYKIYSKKINSFGCFDDCFNFVAGYFINKGKFLYSEIFFNHQPLMAYISSLIQSHFHPQNIYELVLIHRRFVLVFGLLMNMLIIYRFRLPGFLFMLFYEFTKYYLFGDRFLAEGIIVYPLTYMTGLIWIKFNKKKIYDWDYILGAIFTWFVIFMREPYNPIAVLVFVLLIWGKPLSKIKIISVIAFFVLIAITLLFVPFKEYIFNVFDANFNTVYQSSSDSSQIFGSGFFKIFFYPVYLFFGGEWNIFRYFLIGIDIVFLLSSFILGVYYKKIKIIILMFLILGFANIRYVIPGKIFYEAFHMLPWFALFLMITFLMIFDLYKYQKRVALIMFVFLTILFGYVTLSPKSFIWEKIDMYYEFMTNYGNDLRVGETIKTLSNKNDTMFLDGADDLIYWQADLISPYKYSWYTSFMPLIPKYVNARLTMFSKTPPDFYYGTCPNQKIGNRTLPENLINSYSQFYSGGKPTCLYIKKSKILNITADKWKRIVEFSYYLPIN